MTQPLNSSKPEVRATELVHHAGFDRAFSKMIALECFKTHQEAFDHLNDAYELAFGVPRYSSFDSYRVTRAKRLRS